MHWKRLGPMFDDFFVEIDTKWDREVKRIPLRIIGCGALMMQTEYERGTKDSDVLSALDLSAEVQRRLLALAGFDSKIHKQHHVYIDIVASGIPFLPHVPSWVRSDRLNERLKNFEVFVLDVVDVVVSKLTRFSASDQVDIDAMIKRQLVPHERLVARFRDAVDEFSGDARAANLGKYLANLHRVERDLFSVDESEIELPDKY